MTFPHRIADERIANDEQQAAAIRRRLGETRHVVIGDFIDADEETRKAAEELIAGVFRLVCMIGFGTLAIGVAVWSYGL